MRFELPYSSPFPRLQVEDVGWPHLRVKMSDIWTYFLEGGMVDDGCHHYKFLSSFCQTHAFNSFRFNPTSPFGKSILKCSFFYRTTVIHALILASLWIRHPYFLQRRIRPKLLSTKHSLTSSRKLIRFRLKLTTPPHKSTLPSSLPYRHKSSFQPVLIRPASPLLFRPATILYCELTLPGRHPREGVG